MKRDKKATANKIKKNNLEFLTKMEENKWKR